MNTKRLERIYEIMEEKKVTQVLLTDPYAIFYVTGKWQEPGERFFGIYLNREVERNKLFVNKLFTIEEDLGVEKVWFTDTDNAMELVSHYTDKTSALGVDKLLPARFLLPLMEHNAALSYVNASDCIDLVRACKDEQEKEKMRAASSLNDQAIGLLTKKIKLGMKETALAQDLKKIYQELGCDGVSFPPLICFGANAAVGHHEPDETTLAEGDCVLIDIGCKKDFYCADMTRTFFFRNISEKQREVYEIVKEANARAEALIQPGRKLCDIDRAARDFISDKGYGEYFTHRLGHFIGMEVHEHGDVSAVNQNELKPGMIFSIEPGIYLPGELGVRIEDLVLVTEDGCEVLNSYSKDIEMLN